MFPTKDDVLIFVCENSVQLKKPFVVSKSESRRIVFKCKQDGCGFTLSFYKRFDSFYHVSSHQDRTCNEIFPVVKTVWVIEKALEFLNEQGKIRTSTFTQWIHETYQVIIEKTMVSRAISNVKRTVLFESTPFGFIAPFLKASEERNPGTVTSLTSRDGVFERSFLALRMCINPFRHSTRVMGLDACHIKASYGGALLVWTLLDGNGNVFPAALGIAESENESTWTWFLENVRNAFNIGDGGNGLVFVSIARRASTLPSNGFSTTLLTLIACTTSRKT